jgi:hypothetical protein
VSYTGGHKEREEIEGFISFNSVNIYGNLTVYSTQCLVEDRAAKKDIWFLPLQSLAKRKQMPEKQRTSPVLAQHVAEIQTQVCLMHVHMHYFLEE